MADPMILQALENITNKLDTMMASEQEDNGEGGEGEYGNEEANEPASLENELAELKSGEQNVEDAEGTEEHSALANKAKADIQDGQNSFNKPKVDVEALMHKLGRGKGPAGVAVEVGFTGGRQESPKKPNPLSKFRK